MDHQVCLNTNSFPANSSNEAYTLFMDSIHGLLELNEGDDRFILYTDSQITSLNDFNLADKYTYLDFVTALNNNGEQDLCSFLAELEDKTPALQYIDDTIINLIMSLAQSSTLKAIARLE